MDDDMIARRMTEIRKATDAIKERQRETFGFEGLIFLKRQELIKPVQESVYAAVKAVAQREKLQCVFDKAGDLTILYISSVHDYTDYVKEELGLLKKTGEGGDPKADK